MLNLPSKPFALVIQGDCLKVLPHLPAGCVDLTICDPPYESIERHRKVGTTTRLKDSKSSSNPWFKSFPNSLYPKLFAMLYDLHAANSHLYMFCDSETEHIVLSGTNPYHDTTPQHYQSIPAVTSWRAWPSLTWAKTKKGLTWKKLAGRTASLAIAELDTTEIAAILVEDMISTGMGYHWRRATEQILFLEKGKRKLNNLGYGSVLAGPRAGKKDYPVQKPLCVLDRLVENSTQPGEIVLDPFAGSGSAGQAALNRGCSTILIDRDISWMVEHLYLPQGATMHLMRGEDL